MPTSVVSSANSKLIGADGDETLSGIAVPEAYAMISLSLSIETTTVPGCPGATRRRFARRLFPSEIGVARIWFDRFSDRI